MIKSFRYKDTADLAARNRSARWSDIAAVALRKLRQVDAAVSLEDLRAPPGNKLHALKDDRAGQHAIRINDQWRVCFRWDGSDAHEVEIGGYH